mgnify:FL=1
MKKFITIILFIFLWLILNFAFYVAEGAGRPRPGTLIASFVIILILFSLFKKFSWPKKFLLEKKVNIETKSKDLSSEILIENKLSKKRIFSKGWVRLNIVFSFFVPFILFYLVYILSAAYFPLAFDSFSLHYFFNDNYFYGLLLGVFIFHWLLFLFYYLIYKTKNDVISNFWLKIHILISTICGLFFFNFKSLQENYIRDVENDSLRWFCYDIQFHLFLFAITVLAYKIILLLYIWIARGFKDS